MSGDCFIVAANLGIGTGVRFFDTRVLGLEAIELGDHDTLHVVHGLPVGRGPQNEGKRYWHGWVEVTRRIHVPDEVRAAHPELLRLFDDTGELETSTVVDRSSGQDLALPRELYYAMGGLSTEQVWRFTPDEARHELVTRGHYGPWIDDWEDYEEVGT